MLATKMADAWQRREVDVTERAMPAMPAGASARDELYLDSLVNGAANTLSVDVVMTPACGSTVPPTYSGCTA